MDVKWILKLKPSNVITSRWKHTLGWRGINAYLFYSLYPNIKLITTPNGNISNNAYLHDLKVSMRCSQWLPRQLQYPVLVFITMRLLTCPLHRLTAEYVLSSIMWLHDFDLLSSKVCVSLLLIIKFCKDWRTHNLPLYSYSKSCAQEFSGCDTELWHFDLKTAASFTNITSVDQQIILSTHVIWIWIFYDLFYLCIKSFCMV